MTFQPNTFMLNEIPSLKFDSNFNFNKFPLFLTHIFFLRLNHTKAIWIRTCFQCYMIILEVWINNFQIFKKCFNSLQSSFRALCLLKTWFDSLKGTKNCNYLLEGYKSVHHNKHSSRWFIIQNLCQNFWVSPEKIECLCVEIKKKQKIWKILFWV